MSKKIQLILLFTLAISALFTSCKKEEGCTDSSATNYDPDADKDDGTCVFLDDSDQYASLKQEIKENYANIVYASYEDSYNTANDLKSGIESFVANPDQAGFDNCKALWLDAREPYGQTEAYRFAGGPIDDEDGPEGLLNAWPLDEAYIDYVDGMSNSGIVNESSTISTSALEALNEVGGEANVSIGYHAIEFLLWGQDDSNTGLQAPGDRPYTDFVDGGTAENQDRRRDYLVACAELLIQHLGELKDEWDPANTNNFRSSFIQSDSDEALQNVLTGIGTLSKSELAGERIFVALDNQNQEDEHSCFSDNTHRDIILNAQGIRNVYIGSYTRTNGSIINGSSIQDLITEIDATLASEMNSLSSNSVSQTEAIPVPFDNALTQETAGGNGPIMLSINTLQAQGDKIVELAQALGITVNTDLPD